jgi:homogentisate 1,2-dioxygenase
VVFGVVRPAQPMPEGQFYRNGIADEMLFVHEGSGVCRTVFGDLAYGPGDYLVLPIGTTWRLDPDEASAQRILYLEAPSEIEPPKRYRNDYGQLLEHSPYSQRDLHAPDLGEPRDEAGDYVIHVRSTDRITAYHYRHHPFDVVGWDGYLWPFRFAIADFQPITGRVHQPPPVHQTFQARNFVVCSFVPRKFDYHPLAIPAPYNHSNINSDEVIYYVAGNFMSRRGVEIASFTVHPAGIPHGPHPGTVEASIGKEATEELAVMVDTFHPLYITKAAMDLDDDRYPYSWLPPEEGSSEARELAERGPEAFPD